MSTSDRVLMRPFGALAPFARARRLAAEITPPLEGREEEIAVEQASGRVLARPALATVDVPSADRSAMDGYAVCARDLADSGGVLPRARRIAAGEEPGEAAVPGTCIEVATGAPLPPGVDAVVPVEQTEPSGEDVRFVAPVTPGQHIARRGGDVGRGDAVGESGDLITAALLAGCAAAGIQTVSVRQRPRVLVVPTGDEVVPLGQELRPGQVYDSNAAGLTALLASAGADVRRHAIVVDEAAALLAAYQVAKIDLVVTIGGTSVGRRDLVSDCVAEHGEVLLHGVAVRPGKPLLLGRVGGRAAIGLPGFPTTCMMLGYALVAPRVRAMGCRPEPPAVDAILSDDVSSPAGKSQLMPVAVADRVATPTFTVSSAVTAMARAHGWIEIDAEAERLEAGSAVQVHPF